MWSIMYIGIQNRQIIECFKKYQLDVVIKKCRAALDSIKNNNIEKVLILQKSGVYKLKCI